MRPDQLLASFAAAFNQDQRLISLQIGDGGAWGDQLLPQQVTGTEGLNQPFLYDINCLSADAALELKSLLGLPIVLSITDARGEMVERCGVISQAQLLGSDGGFAKYKLTVEPPFALLRYRRTSRVFQSLSVPDLIKQILAEHQDKNPVFASVQTLDFKLSGNYPSRSYITQKNETDYAFICRIMQREGLSWRFVHIAGDSPQVQLVIFDDAYAIPEASDSHVRFHRAAATEEADSLTDWTTQRQLGSSSVALASFDYKAVKTNQAFDDSSVDQGEGGQQIQTSFEDYGALAHYYASDAEGLSHYAQLRQQSHDQAKKSFSGSGTLRSLQAGQWFRLEDHPAHEWDEPEKREFVVTELKFTANNNLPVDLTQQLLMIAPSLLAGSNPAVAAENAPYQADFTAQRRGQALTPLYDESSQPSSFGVQTATVVGPAGAEVHTDELGRIKIQFTWQRAAEHPEFGANLDDKSSCWVRVAYPSAGASWGHQFIPRIGQEVLVSYLDNDIDRPIVTGVVHNGSHPPATFSGAGALPANKTLSGIKTKEHDGGQYGELLFDDSKGEVRTKLSSEHAKTQLNMGFLTHPRNNGKATARGEGAELRSDASISIRAAQGLLLTTYGKLQASGNQLARTEMIELLDQCAELFKAFGDYASSNQALALDQAAQTELIDSIKNWEKGSNADPKTQGGGKPVMSFTAQAGLSFTTPQTILAYAGLNMDVAAKKHLQWTSGERFSLNAGQGISQFAQSGDFRMIAHQGQFLIQAQANDFIAQAEKNIRMIAIDGEIYLMAKKVNLIAEDGSFIKVGDGITLGTKGAVNIKAASKSMSGPATESINLPAFQSGKADQKFQLHYPSSDPSKPQIAALRDYEITLKDGSKLKGVSDAEGKTPMLEEIKMQVAQIRILPKKG